MIIRLKINCSKIQKERLFAGKNGAKYLDLTLLENKNGADEFGNDGFCCQDVSKEEREKGVKGPILGNFKIIRQQGQAQSRPQSRPTAKPASASEPVAGDFPPDDGDEKIPF